MDSPIDGDRVLDELFTGIPLLLRQFVLTLGMALLLGLGLREYYLESPPAMRVGSTRTVMLGAIL